MSGRYGDLRIIVTGARGPLRDDQEAYVRQMPHRVTSDAIMHDKTVVIVHGQCPYGGVDLVAELWAEEIHGVSGEAHPATVTAAGRILGPARNQRMVNAGADLCVAFPGPRSVGTWDCVRRAALAGIIGRVYPI